MNFLKQTFASIVGTIAGLLLFVTLGATGLVFLLFAATAPKIEPQVKNKSILVFDLATQIRDSAPQTNIQQVFSGDAQSTLKLRDVLDALEKAANDDRIVGLLLDGRRENVGSGYAVMAEVRDAIANFQAQGKKIIAYDVAWSEREYYLASIADEVLLNPMGIMEFNGMSSEQMFLKGAFDKYGIGVQVIRVGDYKSAVEPFTREDLSPANRQQTQALLTDLWTKFLSTVGESRDLDPQYLQQVADQKGFIEPEEAKKIKLVDEIAYFDNLTAKLRELTGESTNKTESFRQIKFDDYVSDFQAPVSNANMAKNTIAVVYAEGSIVGGKGNIEQIGSDRFAQEFRELRENDNVKAIVLRVNSPGGSATASEVILREILLTKKEKPVIVSMGNVAASGGYWISAGADQIFAEENTITGSIGVFGLLPNIQEIGNNHGITWDVVQTGKFADINSSVRPKTDAELAIYQKSVAQVYNLFLKKVSEYRNLPKEKVQQIAQGRVWSGKEALNIGLIDQIGGLESAIAFAAKKAELGENWKIAEFPQNKTWESELAERLFKVEALQVAKPVDPLSSQLQKIRQELALVQSFDDPRSIYARLPFEFNID
ncbi:signal peptide peptidase SppA, 67K type [Xenococcus sp. PCC 7305]|uniref:signal peptide peptidase SppA n=1 Tax=Xenococcus sp. PCC 7305 TaxID=102125 RepID=UPI0002ABE1FC|nr:signal peptide peptidase SppA [Xenococcus sp. PCC 7305]ELS05330.1 signal peptide peptidase SppA, 67K type [Xenococcus sp. PCC 7305]